ncbi:MAG: efflux RND transporter periplasmic adaptor subunit [Burkholderiales bacterium]|nr:efflux RND transporter periplasmic adaptor subunit [Burkholderiales bacterium]
MMNNSRSQVAASLVTRLSVFAMALLLAACSEKSPVVEDIRPVRAMQISSAGAENMVELAGDIQPRYESRLGFRVGGKVIARQVEIGSVVKRGQVLMQIDPRDLQLSQSQANASVNAAASNLSLAKAEYERYRELRQKNFVSQAVLDAKEAAYKSALANHEQSNAALNIATNQNSYANLVADADGVVTALQAEAGQVVAAGTPVVQLARTGEKEARISIPEDQVELVRQVKEMQVRIWANQALVLRGQLRELSPVADPATRTYTAKISIPNAPPEVRLGMTATVSFITKANKNLIRLPLTALLNEKNQTSLWVIENGVVKSVPVQVGGVMGNEVVIASGVNAGQMIVTAGVNTLRAGQKVKVLGQELDTKPQQTPQSSTEAGK